MKKLGVFTVLAVSAFSVLLWCSPLKANATSTVNMKFDGTTYDGKGGNSSGGVATYPYYFTINSGSTEIPLLCVSFEDSIKQGETWEADVDPIGTTGLSLTVTEQEEDAYLDSLILDPSSTSAQITDAQWAAWAVGDSGLTTNYLEHNLGLSSSTVGAIDNDISNALAFADSSKTDLAGDPSFYAAYELYVPVDGSQPWRDGLPQTFIGPAPVVPEPSSLILFGSGLLTAAGALYRRKRRTA
jgi:hypothetical protein